MNEDTKDKNANILVPKDVPLDYEEQKRLARHEDPAVRIGVACHPDARPELLYYLAEDEIPDVRRAVANNLGAPRQADLLLTRDSNDTIRSDLALKIARLTPDLPSDRRSVLYKLTVHALEILAEDQLVRVRKILAEALKDVANAPESVIRTLAKDSTLSVAQPVLEFSPVLSDADLLEIIESSPIQGALEAISRRQRLGTELSDAIAEAGDEEAIAELLANRSAQIREETLDMLIERAPSVERWHEPLVLRPKLSAKAARRIASFVAMNLLDKLQKRLDLDDETLVAVAQAVEQRIDEESRAEQELTYRRTDDPKVLVDQLVTAEKLDLDILKQALSQGDRDFVIESIAQLTNMHTEVVGQIVNRRSAKGIVSLAWKAGLPPEGGAILQAQLASIPPESRINIVDGKWPLSQQDMLWQLDFFSRGTTGPNVGGTAPSRRGTP